MPVIVKKKEIIVKHTLFIILIALTILVSSCGQANKKQQTTITMEKREVTESDLPLYEQLKEAITSNDTTAFDTLITQVPDIDYFFSREEEQYIDAIYSLLGYTCRTNKPVFTKKLIEMGADIRSGCESDPYINDNLYIAVYNNAPEIVKMLLEKGADTNGYNDETRFTVLSLACVNDNFDIAKLLIEHGANVDGEGDNEATDYSHYPLVYAVQSGNIKLVQLLLDNGAKIDVANREGGTRYTPLSVAQQADNKEIYNLLRAKHDPLMQTIKLPDLSLYKEVTSSDGKLKLYSRDNGQGGSRVQYDNFLMFDSKGMETPFAGPIYKYLNPNDDYEGDSGTQYEKIDTIQGGGKTYYLVHTLVKAQGGNFGIGLTAYTIDDRLKTVDLFQKGQVKTDSFWKEVWGSDMERLYYYAKDENSYYVPIIEETGDMQMSIEGYDKYQWQSNLFVFTETVGKRFWLHSSLREFKELDAEFDTDRFHIRIDEIQEKVYRYTSWSKGQSTAEMPDLVIQNGKNTLWDSSQKQFTFQNNEYTYICTYQHADAKGAFTGSLIVKQNDKEIVKENIVGH